MAAIINLGNDFYFGDTVCGVDCYNGDFLRVDFSNLTSGHPANTSQLLDPLYMVVNESDYNMPSAGAEGAVRASSYLKLKRLLPGEIFTSSRFSGDLKAGDIVAPDVGGLISLKGSRNVSVSFVVIERSFLWGLDTVRCVVL